MASEKPTLIPTSRDRLRASSKPILRALASAHDAITRAGYVVGASLVAFMAASFCYEVVARYAFGAPTSWANALVSYALCVAIFIAMPELTRLNAHIAINLLVDRLSPRNAARLSQLIRLLAVVACALAAAICINETWRQYLDNIDTISVYPVPKWWITAFIPYGMLSASIYFTRQLCGEQTTDADERGLL
jgi:C4-dicarboxylate transporter, DctQ subunit